MFSNGISLVSDKEKSIIRIINFKVCEGGVELPWMKFGLSLLVLF